VTVAEALSGSGIDLFEARLLLASASGLSRAALAAHPDALLNEAAADRFRAAAARRRAGEPIAYLLGEREFYGVSLAVTPDVLIPRPETELLVEFALEHLPPGGRLLDLGTGSGAIALAIKQQRPDALVTAVERSPSALAVARENSARHALEVEFLQGSWFEPLSGRRFDIVVSNPPYVAAGDRHLEQGDLRFEPRTALVGGADGLDAIRVISLQAPSHFLAGGWLAIEHGLGQDSAVRNLLAGIGLESVSSRPDLAGIARISVGKYNPD
jgi:release factor glutamine methyltransferase